MENKQWNGLIFHHEYDKLSNPFPSLGVGPLKDMILRECNSEKHTTTTQSRHDSSRPSKVGKTRERETSPAPPKKPLVGKFDPSSLYVAFLGNRIMDEV
jgi:hypothetical protein